MIASAAYSDGQRIRRARRHPAGTGTLASSTVALRITPRNNDKNHNREVPLHATGFSTSRLHQLVKRSQQSSWQNAAKVKILATLKLPSFLARPWVVSQNATISKGTLSHLLCERAANDNTLDAAPPPQTLSVFCTIERLLESAADALPEGEVRP